MTLNEIWEQAKTLSSGERKELAKRLIDLMDAPGQSRASESEEHWGKDLLRRMDEVGPIELIHPEIDDPVEWVKQIRRDQQRHVGDWGSNE
jgi:hypothetical protein